MFIERGRTWRPIGPRASLARAASPVVASSPILAVGRGVLSLESAPPLAVSFSRSSRSDLACVTAVRFRLYLFWMESVFLLHSGWLVGGNGVQAGALHEAADKLDLSDLSDLSNLSDLSKLRASGFRQAQGGGWSTETANSHNHRTRAIPITGTAHERVRLHRERPASAAIAHRRRPPPLSPVGTCQRRRVSSGGGASGWAKSNT